MHNKSLDKMVVIKLFFLFLRVNLSDGNYLFYFSESHRCAALGFREFRKDRERKSIALEPT